MPHPKDDYISNKKAQCLQSQWELNLGQSNCWVTFGHFALKLGERTRNLWVLLIYFLSLYHLVTASPPLKYNKCSYQYFLPQLNVYPGNTNWRGRLSTVDLIKVAYFENKVNYIFNTKGAEGSQSYRAIHISKTYPRLKYLYIKFPPKFKFETALGNKIGQILSDVWSRL